MKRSFWCVLFVTSFVFSLSMDLKSVAAESITLRWATPSPKTGPEKEFFPWAAAELEKRTEGRVKADIYWGGSLVKIKEQAQAVRQGLADIGWVMYAYTPDFGEIAKVHAATGLFAINTDPVVLTKAWIEADEETSYLTDDFKTKNMIPFIYKWYDNFDDFTNKPIRSLADYKGVKVRAVDEAQQTALKAIGGVPVHLPISETYSALSKNIVDGIWSAPSPISRYKLYQVTKYIIKLDLAGLWAYYCLNLDTFNKLSKMDQQIVLNLRKEISLKMAAETLVERKTLFDEFQKAGLETIKVPEHELRAWGKDPAILQYFNDTIEELEQKGLPAKKLQKVYVDLVNKISSTR